MTIITKDQTSAAGTDKAFLKQQYLLQNQKKVVIAPVSSLRFGHCLEIDLFPFKMCTFNCIYCQRGHTDFKTVVRREPVSVDKVIAELETKLPAKPDYIMISGSGEPTLYSGIGELIESIRMLTDIPVAVLTNGSLLWHKEVRKSLLNADLVVPSLDATSDLMFQTINRPHTDISFEQLIEGMTDFRSEYSGRYWLEIMLLAGYTAILSEITKLADYVKKIRPDKVQLNTITTSAAESYAQAVEQNRLNELAAFFEPLVEVIADFDGTNNLSQLNIKNNVILTPKMKGDHYARI